MSNKEINKLYAGGRSCADIATISKCSETTIYNKLKSLNTVFRSRSEANKVLPDFIFILLCNLGLSSSQVGKILGVNSSTVIKRLQSIDFPTRSRRLASKIKYTHNEFETHFMQSDIVNNLRLLIKEVA